MNERPVNERTARGDSVNDGAALGRKEAGFAVKAKGRDGG